MVYDSAELSTEDAGRLLEACLGQDAPCRSVRRLHGGMINSVLLLEFDRSPHRAVAKLSSRSGPNPFTGEEFALRYIREHSRFPVPEPYLCADAGAVLPQHVLLMECLPGDDLGNVPLTHAGREQIDRHLAELLLELHSHTGDRYGAVDGSEAASDWRDVFLVKITENVDDCRGRLPDDLIERMEAVLGYLPEWFASQSPPTLVHGDIWATNVLVEQSEGSWRVTGLVDPSGRYADVEFELAYMEVFGTVTDAFFDAYCRESPLREGYEVRRLYYWLDTMLRHVFLFGDHQYTDRAARITRELERFCSGAART